MMLQQNFFNQDCLSLAVALLGKIMRVKHYDSWLACRIIETESYLLTEKGSHSSLGFTKKRQALFMDPGTIYMYYARGNDSLNISAQGKGDAVLIKSGFPYTDELIAKDAIQIMQQLNPTRNNQLRSVEYLCSGQTLLCKSLGLKVTQWDQQQFCADKFYISDDGYIPTTVIQTPRLGIPQGRDEHLLYRFIDFDYAKFCTSNPLTVKRWQGGKDYKLHSLQDLVTLFKNDP